MQKFIAVLAFTLLSFAGFSQTTAPAKKATVNAVVSADGNYTQPARAARTTAAAVNTGKTYTLRTGEKLPVMKSVKGDLYVVRTSKNGNQYKQYLKTE
jgi:putative hemolysin